MTDQEQKLLPCPCGSNAHRGGSSTVAGNLEQWVECDKCCGFTMRKWAFLDRKQYTPEQMNAAERGLYEAVEKAWNTRAQPTPAPDAQAEAERLANIANQCCYRSDGYEEDLCKDIAASLQSMLERGRGEKCSHSNFHRGGTIWTICDDCGEKWADDEGGPPQSPSQDGGNR